MRTESSVSIYLTKGLDLGIIVIVKLESVKGELVSSIESQKCSFTLILPRNIVLRKKVEMAILTKWRIEEPQILLISRS